MPSAAFDEVDEACPNRGLGTTATVGGRPVTEAPNKSAGDDVAAYQRSVVQFLFDRARTPAKDLVSRLGIEPRTP